MRKCMPYQRTLRLAHAFRTNDVGLMPIQGTAHPGPPHDGPCGQETTTVKTILVAASLLALLTGVARAAEGNSEPFPNHASTGQVVANQIVSDTGSQASPSFGPGVIALTQGDMLPANGSNGIVQTANSLPPGFEEVTVAYTQARSVQKWMLAHQGSPAAGPAFRSASNAR
jgi:hypothetical protein